METIWFQQQLSDRFSMGLQLRNSGIRYRFVNARAIEEGNTLFIGVVVGLKVKESESYRLDFNLTTSYRRLQNDDKVELPENTDGLEIDPNIIMTLPLNDRLFFHTGAMLRLAMQTGPESIGNEQGLSAIVLNGLSLRSGSNVFSLKTYAGPMNGATGDTEKFFWQVALSYQFSLSGKNSASLPFFNF
ncbi:MAG: hypothetical protein AAF696_13655 [Bacteroidota bacterium]